MEEVFACVLLFFLLHSIMALEGNKILSDGIKRKQPNNFMALYRNDILLSRSSLQSPFLMIESGHKWRHQCKASVGRYCQGVHGFKLDPVCGSDGHYYFNRCELHHAACRNKAAVRIDHVCSKEKAKKRACSRKELKRMKDNLIKFFEAKFVNEQENSASKQHLVGMMFEHYDENGNEIVSTAELKRVSENEQMSQLSPNCRLSHLLLHDDLDGNGKIYRTEFLQAFEVPIPYINESERYVSYEVTAGNFLQLTCNIQNADSVVWRRSGIQLSTIRSIHMKILGGRFLYLSEVKMSNAGNYTCHEQYDKHIFQTHMLHVTAVPAVRLHPANAVVQLNGTLQLQCHSFPAATNIQWWRSNVLLDGSNPHFSFSQNGLTLTINKTTSSDAGRYKCIASNRAGKSKATSDVLVGKDYMATITTMFYVFHNRGITAFQPASCNVEYGIQASNIILGTDGVVCNGNCVWGDAVNVDNRYLYASQPQENRILLIDIMKNEVIQVIHTDRYPVKLYYMRELKEVWVICWRSAAAQEDANVKTVQVIRHVAQPMLHHTVHTQPINHDHFDLVENVFLPVGSDFGGQFSHGYVIHKNEAKIYKLDLEKLSYVDEIHLSAYNCLPTHLEFVPIGGFIIINCKHQATGLPSGQLVMDYVTDSVLASHAMINSRSYVTPDSKFVVSMDSKSGIIYFQAVTDKGLSYLFDVRTRRPLNSVTFHPSEDSYDAFISPTNRKNLLRIKCSFRKVQIIKVAAVDESSPQAAAMDTLLVSSSGLFHKYLVTASHTSAFLVNINSGKLECELDNIGNASVIVWVDRP